MEKSLVLLELGITYDDLKLKSVLYVPNLRFNLMSIIKLLKDQQCIVTCFPTHCEFQERSSGKMIGIAKEYNGLYFFIGPLSQSHYEKHLSLSVTPASNVLLWHQRLGHPSFDYLKRLYPKLFNKDYSVFQCESCVLAEQTRKNYPNHTYQPSQPFSIVHSDIWGPSRTLNINGSRWFITFIDDHTRACWVYLLKNKSDSSAIFKQFHKHVSNVFQSKIQVLRTDNGGEYFSNDLKDYLNENGILHQSSCTKTPQQNGVAKRKNRHLLEISRAIMINNHVPHSF